MRRWFVTPAANPDRRLDGPFATLEQASARCVLYAEREGAVRALAEGKLPGYYVPRQFDVNLEGEVLHLYSPPKRHERAPVAQPNRLDRGAVHLPELVYGYTRSDLVALCWGLQLKPPPDGADRRGIIKHMESELAKLAKSCRPRTQK